jgi:hypothetical protein
MVRYAVALFLFAWSAGTALAYKPAPPMTYAIESPDGRHVFVMISPLSAARDLEIWNEETQDKIRAIRGKFPKSGMYRNDGSTEPLWVVDWYAYVVDVPSGGEYVVRYTSGGYGWGKQPALAFYRRGALLRAYEVGDLIAIPALIDRGDWLDQWTLDDAGRMVEVTTELGDNYVFDVQTGEMISRFRPVRYAIVGTGAVVLGVAVWLVRRHLRRRRPITSS